MTLQRFEQFGKIKDISDSATCRSWLQDAGSRLAAVELDLTLHIHTLADAHRVLAPQSPTRFFCTTHSHTCPTSIKSSPSQIATPFPSICRGVPIFQLFGNSSPSLPFFDRQHLSLFFFLYTSYPSNHRHSCATDKSCNRQARNAYQPPPPPNPHSHHSHHL